MILRVEDLSVGEILRGINFSVKRGEILIIVGESGSGKTTVLKAIGGLLDKKFSIGGKILFEGREITNLSAKERRKLSGSEIGFIFQNAGASFCPIRKIGEQIFESVRAHRDWDEKTFRRRAINLMEKMNLAAEVLEEYPFRLSGGMAQRAGILAATILEPKLLLADEPTSALDVMTQAGVVKELLNLRERTGITIVMVTHNMAVARHMADKILIMKDGKAIEYGTNERSFKS